MGIIIDIESKESVKNAAEVLKRGGILIFPTDTVYGIGCINRTSSIKMLYKIKNRPLSQPTAILINNDNLLDLKIPGNIMENFKSGKMTLIISKDSINFKPDKTLLKNQKIGIRIPNHTWLKDLISKVGPIVASSANKKGERTPINFKDISTSIINKADVVISAKSQLKGKPSRVYDLESDQYLR